MNNKPNTITIDDIVYVRKDSIKNMQIPKSDQPYVIVRTYSAGVWAGNIVTREDGEIKLTNARRLWRWHSQFTLSELATIGCKDKNRCKFAVPVPSVLLQWIEIIDCTQTAIDSITSIKNYNEV